MMPPIRTEPDFNRAISLMTREAIEEILPRERILEESALMLARAEFFLEKYGSERQVKLRLDTFAGWIEELVKDSHHFAKLVRDIANGKILPHNIREAFQEFLAAPEVEALKKGGFDGKIDYINQEKVGIEALQMTPELFLKELKGAKTSLIYADLSGMPFSEGELTLCLQLIPKAKSLVIRGGKFSNEGFKALFSLKDLEILEVSSSSLSLLDDRIADLVNLKQLNLSKNWLGSLPAKIRKLEKLVALNVQENMLEYLPKEIGELGCLEVLNLRLNKLKSLPDEIVGCKRLAVLDVSKNQMLELPENFGALESLKELNIARNWIKRLPTSFKELVSLETLDLSDNTFEFFPEELLELTNLKKVKVSGNDLPAIPYEHLKGVEVVD